ncbi:MAG: glycosyltransferase family 2 protein [Gemmatimonadaceae bacterium]
MTTKVPVTVVIAARNEADQIGDCVRSVAFAAEVLVVENDSTDATVKEASHAGATVFTHPFTTIGGQRNAAIARATQPWILVLDADERATPALGVEVANRLAAPDGLAAWRVPRRNLFLGREIRHGGWERDRPVRLFARTLRYDDHAVHEHVVTTGRVGMLHEPLSHVPYDSLDEYLEKLGRYSRGWAAQHFARGRRASMWSVVTKPPARFFSMLVLRGGFLDGVAGVLLAVLAAISVATKYALLWELGRRPGQAD